MDNLEEILANIILELPFSQLEKACKELNIPLEYVLEAMEIKGYTE